MVDFSCDSLASSCEGGCVRSSYLPGEFFDRAHQPLILGIDREYVRHVVVRRQNDEPIMPVCAPKRSLQFRGMANGPDTDIVIERTIGTEPALARSKTAAMNRTGGSRR